jgi:hypothetical protein
MTDHENGVREAANNGCFRFMMLVMVLTAGSGWWGADLDRWTHAFMLGMFIGVLVGFAAVAIFTLGRMLGD